MKVERRSRAFWKRLIAEVERGATIARTAERHGVRPKTLTWWRWRLRREDAAVPNARLLPVVFRAGPARAITSRPESVVIEARDDLSLRVLIGSDVSYVAALVAAIRTTC